MIFNVTWIQRKDKKRQTTELQDRYMIKVTFLYPNTDGSKFDMDYYLTDHVDLAKRLLGSALKGASIDRGLSSIVPGSKPPYHAIGHLLFDSVDAFYEAIGPHVETLRNDVANYSENEAVIQISELADA